MNQFLTHVFITLPKQSRSNAKPFLVLGEKKNVMDTLMNRLAETMEVVKYDFTDNGAHFTVVDYQMRSMSAHCTIIESVVDGMPELQGREYEIHLFPHTLGRSTHVARREEGRAKRLSEYYRRDIASKMMMNGV